MRSSPSAEKHDDAVESTDVWCRKEGKVEVGGESTEPSRVKHEELR